MPYILRKNEKLLKNTKKIFGEELVSNAYYSIFVSGEHEIKHLGKHIEERFSDMIESNEREISDIKMKDNHEIVIDFSNGKSVVFNSSNWGGLSDYDHEKDTYSIT